MRQTAFASSLFALSLVLAACGGAEDPPADAPADPMSAFPDDYVIAVDMGELETVGIEEASGEAELEEGSSEEDNLEGAPETELSLQSRADNAERLDRLLTESRERNADLAEALARAEEEISRLNDNAASIAAQRPAVAGAALSQIQQDFLAEAIAADSPAFSFPSCGRVSQFFGRGWFTDFSQKLADARLTLSSGELLSPERLFGGCESTEGALVFFLGARSGDSGSEFVIIKYDTRGGNLAPALAMANTSGAVVTSFGKRSGPFVRFPADDGRVFRYFYHANVIVAE